MVKWQRVKLNKTSILLRFSDVKSNPVIADFINFIKTNNLFYVKQSERYPNYYELKFRNVALIHSSDIHSFLKTPQPVKVETHAIKT